MSAYWIGRARTRDAEALKEYGRLVAHASSVHPNEVLVRGGRTVVLEGGDSFDRHVIIKFHSVEEAVAFYHSPEYQAARPIRHANCEISELVIVEGID